MEKFFKLKENGTTVGREIVAGLTTFFAMAYIIVVNPNTLSGRAGGLEEELMPWGAVFLATIIASIIGTLVMGLVANVPYAQAPGMGLNAFFVYTVCLGLGFTWQQTLSMVFICGLINILITVTKLRKFIIKSIPRSLQNAIGGGIGIFVAYIGFLNIDVINFTGGAVAEDGATIITSGIVPELAKLNTPVLWLFLIGLAITIILLVLNVKGAILIGIVASALLGIPMGVTALGDTISFTEACQQLPTTFCAIFTPAGLPSLFADAAKIPPGADHHFCLQHFPTPSTPSAPSLAPAAAPASSPMRTRRPWRPRPASTLRWTRPCSPTHRHFHWRHLRHQQHHHLCGERCRHALAAARALPAWWLPSALR